MSNNMNIAVVHLGAVKNGFQIA